VIDEPKLHRFNAENRRTGKRMRISDKTAVIGNIDAAEDTVILPEHLR